jgi:hypothetical protein
MGVPDSTIGFYSRASIRDPHPACREMPYNNTLHGLEKLPIALIARSAPLSPTLPDRASARERARGRRG